MSGGPQLFISFSSMDQHDVRTLFAALQLQGIDCWDYSAAGQELPLGKSVEVSLRERIDACDYFIAIVSKSTTDETSGRFTRFELQYAIDQGLLEDGKILPVLLTANPPTDWSGPYRRLQAIRWVEFHGADAATFDERMAEICAKLKVPYVPPSLRDPRVFFSRYLLQEAEQVKLTNAEFIRLMQIMNKCAEEVATGQWLAAKELISSFLQLGGLLIPRVQLTYPIILKGVCELQLGEFNDAEQSFTKATRAAGPQADYFAGLGNAGLGHACYQQQRFDEAAVYFNRALELLPDDKDVEFNRLSSLLHSGIGIMNAAGPDEIDQTALTADEPSQARKLSGVFHYKRGEYQAAIDAFRSLEGELDEVSAIYLSRAHTYNGNETEALEILRNAAARLGTANLYHHLASAYVNAGSPFAGLEIYERVLCQPACRKRQYLVEYALILKAIDEPTMRNKIREICNLVLNLEQFSQANLSGEDFYYMGFANYLLGRYELARYEFERSSGFDGKYYDHEEFGLE